MTNLVIYPSDAPNDDPPLSVWDDTPDSSKGTLMGLFWETKQAQLYTAAPDLLAALEAAAGVLLKSHPDAWFCSCDHAKAYRAARSAIAKAKAKGE